MVCVLMKTILEMAKNKSARVMNTINITKQQTATKKKVCEKKRNNCLPGANDFHMLSISLESGFACAIQPM